VPSSTLVPLSEMVVDHRAYLGGAFALVLLARLVLRPQSPVLVVASLVLLAALSVRYERILGDPVRAWEDAVARAPGAPEAQRGLAEAYAQRGDPRAEATLEAAVRLDPHDAQSWTNLGVRYAETGRYTESIEAFSAAASAAPQDARIQDNLGLLLRSVGRVDEARRAFESAARLDPRLASARINLAEILLDAGDTSGARHLVDEAARLEIDAEDAKRIEAVRAHTKDAEAGSAR
jgi:Flp pilus assembly protein TadD